MGATGLHATNNREKRSINKTSCFIAFSLNITLPDPNGIGRRTSLDSIWREPGRGPVPCNCGAHIDLIPSGGPTDVSAAFGEAARPSRSATRRRSGFVVPGRIHRLVGLSDAIHDQTPVNGHGGIARRIGIRHRATYLGSAILLTGDIVTRHRRGRGRGSWSKWRRDRRRWQTTLNYRQEQKIIRNRGQQTIG